MKKTIFAATVAVLALASGAAVAADFPRSSAPYYNPAPSSLYNWGGVYAGLNLGYGWGKVTNSGANPSGILGGGQVGYNWQSGPFVYGAEADLQGSNANDTFASWKFSNPWFGTLRGRAGYAFNNILVYGTLGLAIGESEGRDRRRRRDPYTRGMDRRRRCRGRPDAELVGESRIPVHGPGGSRVRDHRYGQRLPLQHRAIWIQLSLLSCVSPFAWRKPRAARPGVFFVRTAPVEVPSPT